MSKKAQPGNEDDDDVQRGPDDESGDDDATDTGDEGADQGGDQGDEGTGGEGKKGDKGEPTETVEEAIAKSLGLGENADADKKGDQSGKEKPKDEGKGKPEEGKKADDKEETDKKEDKKDGKGKPDPYEVPEGLKPKAQARFQELVHVAREKDTTITKQNEVISGFREMVRATGATDRQFLESLDVLTLINKEPAKAAQRLYNAACELALAYNVDIPGVDFLKDFPDLQKQIEEREITPEAAREVANSRRSQAMRTVTETRTREVQEQQQATQKALKDGADQIENFLKDKENNDIDFNAKAEELHDAAQYAAENLSPDKWLGYMTMEYERVSKLLAKSNGSANNRGSNRPLRPGSSQGGNKAPASDVDAVTQALGLGG